MKHTNKLTSILAAYANSKAARFHMPGHKGMLPKNSSVASVSGMDITELSFSDNLHDPHGVIVQVEANCADTFGCYRSFLLVNGSTAGMLAMLLALGRGKRILMGRDCHKSAIAGAALSGATVTPLYPEYADGRFGVVSPVNIRQAFAKNSYDAIVLTYPNYYGMCFDIEQVADIVHSHGALLLIDSAHGAHNCFSHSFTAPTNLADIYVTSLHKTLPAMTQCAVLNVSERAKHLCKRIQASLRLVQTSSPSYILMSSIGESITIGASYDWHAHKNRLRAYRERINAIEGVCIPDYSAQNSVYETDELRLCISLLDTDGYSAMRHLEENDIYIEMADLNTLVLITSPCDPDEWYERLIQALKTLPATKAPAYLPNVPDTQTYPLDFGTAMLGEYERMPLENALGRTAAQPIGVYPPGNAVILPSETITGEAIVYLSKTRNLGGSVFGIDDGEVYCTKPIIDI